MAAWRRNILSALVIRDYYPRASPVCSTSHVPEQPPLLDPSCGQCGLPTHTSTRGFFNLISKKKDYAGKKLVGYSMEQMYEVVSDVEHYRDFVPFCKRSLVLVRKPDFLRADLVVGFPPINESYTSRVTLERPYLVKAVCTEGKLFNHLLTNWRFSPGLHEQPLSCVIDFSVSFEFRSALHSQLAHLFFNELVRQMESAFVTEARRRYGKASIPTQKIRGVIPTNS